MISKNNTSDRSNPKKIKRVVSNRTLTMLGASLAVSLMAGCASVDKQPVNEPVVANEPVEEQAQVASEAKEEVSTANADQLMDTLKAPLVEPKSESKAADKGDSTETVSVNKPEPVVENEKAKVVEKTAVVEKQSTAKKEKKAVTEQAKTAAEPIKAVPEKVQKTTKAVAKSGAKALSVTKKDLPVSYDIWVIKQGETSLSQGLVISTPTWEMGKTGYTSQIWLTLKENEIHINSSSDIATEVKGLGIRIDGGELIPFSRIAENNIGIVEGEWLDKLAAANSMDIHLGFFPGKKPTSDNFKSNTSLENLDRIVATYRNLNN